MMPFHDVKESFARGDSCGALRVMSEALTRAVSTEGVSR
jgi:hypothetical protein